METEANFVGGATKIFVLLTSIQVNPGMLSGIGTELILKLTFGSEKLAYKPYSDCFSK